MSISGQSLVEPVHVFIGWDPRDAYAYQACEDSLRAHASVPIEVHGLVDHELRARGVYRRAYRVACNGQMTDDIDGKPFSTGFSFSRFLVPALLEYRAGLAVFCDADMMYRRDIADLIALCRADRGRAVWCVKHDHVPIENVKMDGVRQTRYRRKNWSSLMIFSPPACRALTVEAVNTRPGAWLHGMDWAADAAIGGLPATWNWLEGYSPADPDPAVVHYTRGTPDFPGYEASAFAGEWRGYFERG